MLAEAEVQEYLDEIRKEVCSRCVEQPLGGPPCNPLGKMCGVELHLPQLIAAVGEVHSDLMDPYLESTRQKVCQSCPYLHHDCCPCPMDTLALLVVQAIEDVDQRRQRRQRGRGLIENLPPTEEPGIEAVLCAYKEAVGTWTGCDWPTVFGPAGLDLEGVSAAEAETLAVESLGTAEAESWVAAAKWLDEVESRARQAEREAALAVTAANAGAWAEAVGHARKAWALEFHTGRTLRRTPPTWQRLLWAVKAATKEHSQGEPGVGDRGAPCCAEPQTKP
jgi:hypothetical protein